MSVTGLFGISHQTLTQVRSSRTQAVQEKVRVPKEDQGKSGGYRLVTYYLDRHTPVFLLTVLDKSKKANLSEGEKKAAKVAAKSEKKQRRQ